MNKLCKDTMIQSYNGISFYGERRGAQDFDYYTELLKSDLEELGENQGNYKEKFIDKVMTIYHRQMSCTSAFIVGPANYNISRHNKKWASRDNAYDAFNHWREKYFKAVNRVRTLSPEAEIDKTIKEIDSLIIQRDAFKHIRKESKSNKDFDLMTYLEEVFPDWSDESKQYIYDNGIMSYQVASLTTRIRERKKKIEVMKARIKVKQEQKTVFFNGGSIYIENDRVIIAHDEKPDREIIQAIKKNGFRWSPKMGNWCRKHTANARHSANYLLNNVFGGELSE